MKIKLFKNENNFKKKEFILNSNLYWKFFVGGALLIILFSFYFAFNLFVTVNTDPATPFVGGAGTVPSVDKGRIEAALNYFTQREQKSAEILNSPSPVVDPSL